MLRVVVVVVSKVAAVQSGTWSGDVETECVGSMIRGDCGGRGWTVLVCVDSGSCFQAPDDILPVFDLRVKAMAMAGVGSEEWVEDSIMVRVVVGTVVFGVGHYSAAQSTLGQLQAA